MRGRVILDWISLVFSASLAMVIFTCPAKGDLFYLHRFSFVIGGDWANYGRMRSVGDTYIRDNLSGNINLLSSTTYIDRVASGPGFSVQVFYQLKPRVSLGITATYMMPDYFAYNRVMHFEDDYYRRRVSKKHLLEADLFAPGAVVKYRFPVERLELDLSVGALWLFASARLMHTDWRNMPLPPNIAGSEKTKFHADGIGFLLSLGTAFKFSRLSIAPNAGYRFLETGRVKDADDYHWEGMHLDFSGPYIGMNFELRP